MTSCALRPFVVALLVLMPLCAVAQTQNAQPAAASQQVLKAEQLEALVAPVALYPDTFMAKDCRDRVEPVI